MNNVTSKVRGKLKPKHASDESVALGEAKAKAKPAAGDRTKTTMPGRYLKARQTTMHACSRQPEQPAYFTYAPQGNDSSQER